MLMSRGIVFSRPAEERVRAEVDDREQQQWVPERRERDGHAAQQNQLEHFPFKPHG